MRNRLPRCLATIGPHVEGRHRLVLLNDPVTHDPQEIVSILALPCGQGEIVGGVLVNRSTTISHTEAADALVPQKIATLPRDVSFKPKYNATERPSVLSGNMRAFCSRGRRWSCDCEITLGTKNVALSGLSSAVNSRRPSTSGQLAKATLRYVGPRPVPETTTPSGPFSQVPTGSALLITAETRTVWAALGTIAFKEVTSSS